MNSNIPLTLLGGLTPSQFMRRHWQKKPLLVRQAVPGFSSPLSWVDLKRLAGQADVESRLIMQEGADWRLRQGPLSNHDFPTRHRDRWTFLVQGVNLHDDRINEFMRQFRFVPDARLDDLMISYATDTGGVGPHLDSYDVFLLQAEGRRRWRIGRQTDRSLIEGAPIKLLRHFTPTHEYLLEPGDMLYLPPHWGHEGVAVGECMTYSIGFRAPTWQELGEAYLGFLAEQVDLSGRYRDKQRAPELHPARLGNELLQQARQQLGKLGGRQIGRAHV